jgi:predicted Rossmann fold nucleotide-binding protein DprA/Smf involved in DNA uptake
LLTSLDEEFPKRLKGIADAPAFSWN